MLLNVPINVFMFCKIYFVIAMTSTLSHLYRNIIKNEITCMQYLKHQRLLIDDNPMMMYQNNEILMIVLKRLLFYNVFKEKLSNF